MAFTRSLLTRLCEGLVRDFLANADVASYWGARFFNGPYQATDESIAVPQGTVLPAPGTAKEEPGVSGVQGNQILSVLVGIYEPYRPGPLPTGPTALNEYDRLQLLKTIITAGTDGGNQGKIIDPDQPGSNDPVQKYLNVDMPTFKDVIPRLVLAKDRQIAAVFWGFGADFRTRIDNITLLRK